MDKSSHLFLMILLISISDTGTVKLNKTIPIKSYMLNVLSKQHIY